MGDGKEEFISDRMAIRELFHLVRLNWSCKDYEKPERSALRTKAARWFGGLALSIFGWLFAGSFILTAVVPPYVQSQLLIGIFGLLYIVVLLPSVGRRFRGYVSGWGDLITRVVMLVGCIPMMAIVQLSYEAKKDLRLKKEAERIQAMAPDERQRYEDRKKYDEVKIKETEEREAIERSAKEWDERQAERAKNDLAKKVEATKESNIEQRKFYDELSAPKILYKCKNSNVEKAVGAKIGSVNVLIDAAQKDCITSGFEIIKKKE